MYGYTTKRFNEQVKNNIEKFDDDFRFQLTKEEYDEILRSKNSTSKISLTDCESVEYDNDAILRSKFFISKTENRGGRQYLPYAFTEQGIYMLMTVLKGDLAISSFCGSESP
ncbi:MAG: ORF6N domain-containing protein [Muribaculaceae bacterium]|nr:ORF6N domain-containing protein [Muribaculaceae bacterium]